MPTFVALLRGVNVGKAKRVPMAELRTLLTGLRYTDVATVLNSGNAVFRTDRRSSRRLAADVSAAILDRFQFEVPVVVKSAKELSAIVAESPIAPAADEHSRLLVVFVQEPKSLSDLARIESLVVPPERFAICKQAAYLFCPAGILESKAAGVLLGKGGSAVTTRNWATVLKLQGLAGQPERRGGETGR